MEFRFNLNNYIKQELIKIQNSLIPEGFTSSDRNEYGKCVEAMTEILHDMGVASAKAQGLNASITSGEKLKNADQILYLFSDLKANNGRGVVIGLLKIGQKNLFLVDQNGKMHERKANCVLDFYVHESKQRMGCGKFMFDRMLKEMNVLPEQLAIDKPSELFLRFLEKHYGLHNIMPQNNNFVIFDGFFGSESVNTNRRISLKNANQKNKVEFVQVGSDHNGMPDYGRHAAFKAVTTMKDILHDESSNTASDTISHHHNNEQVESDHNGTADHGRHAAFKAVTTMKDILHDQSLPVCNTSCEATTHHHSNGHHNIEQVGTCQNGMANYGRHAASKAISTMGDILQPQSLPVCKTAPDSFFHNSNNNHNNEKCHKSSNHDVNISPIDTEPASSERSLSPVSCASSQGINSGRVSPAFSCRSDDPERLDLKFHHTHLW